MDRPSARSLSAPEPQLGWSWPGWETPLPKPGSIQASPGMPIPCQTLPCLTMGWGQAGARHHASVGLGSPALNSRAQILNKLMHHRGKPTNVTWLHLLMVPSAARRVCLLCRAFGVSHIYCSWSGMHQRLQVNQAPEQEGGCSTMPELGRTTS